MFNLYKKPALSIDDIPNACCINEDELLGGRAGKSGISNGGLGKGRKSNDNDMHSFIKLSQDCRRSALVSLFGIVSPD
jgi:hypothetical protein